MDHVTSRMRCPLRRLTFGEGGCPWKERRVGRSWFATASCELLIVPSSASNQATALPYSVLENQEGLWALKSPNTIWCPRSTRRASKSEARERRGIYTLKKVSEVRSRSVSTARTSTMSKCATPSWGEKRGTEEEEEEEGLEREAHDSRL